MLLEGGELPPPYTSMWQVYKEMIPDLIKQTRDPDHFTRRPVPAARARAPDARILLVLHGRHTEGARRPEDVEAVARWRREGWLYTPPAGMNDDWYWLHAAVMSGAACRVISNDEMRDHHFGLLDTTAFTRWKERHVTRFAMRLLYDPSAGRVSAQPPVAYTADCVRLHPPLPYSHVMQEHAHAPDVWHVPCAADEGSDAKTADAPSMTDGRTLEWVCLRREGGAAGE